jgi:branched-chain amino acid aminotransferase group I
LERVVFHNGVFAKENKVLISPFNRGLLYGDGVFETLRAYAGQVFRLEKHLERLKDSLHYLRIAVPLKNSEIRAILHELLKVNGLSDASLRITVFRENGGGLEPSAPTTVGGVLISAKPMTQYQPEDYLKGFRARVVSIRRNVYSPLSWMKSLNYLENILGRFESRENNAQEALFLNTHGWVVEGATSNIFIVKGKKLITPPEEAAILPGITRGVVLEIAPTIVEEVSQSTFALEELLDTDEAFLTNSLMEIMPLVSVNNVPLGEGLPGPVTKNFLHHYRCLVKKELGLPV